MSSSTHSESFEFASQNDAHPAWMTEIDWRRTTLGEVSLWTGPLKSAAAMVMRSPRPLLLVWGRDSAVIFNAAFAREFLETPVQAMGQGLVQATPRLADAELLRAVAATLDGMPQLLDQVSLQLPLDERRDAGSGSDQGDTVVALSLAPCPDATGHVGGVILSVAQTSARRREHLHLESRLEHQRRLFQQAPGFICTLAGPEHRYDFINDEYVRLFGERAVVGRTVKDTFPELEGQGVFELLDKVRSTGVRHVSRGHQVTINSPTGQSEQRWLDFIYAPILDGDGRVEGIFCEGQDRTESHLAQVALAEREEQLRLATEAADIGLWDVDLVRETLFWPPRVKAMFGISAEEPVSMADYYAGLHPLDREAVSAAFAAACDPGQRALYDVEYRTIGKEDGVLRYVAAKGRGIFEGERCVRVIGTAIDISRRKADEEALRASEAAHRESARRKDQFIATLAHELRNPLAPLRNTLALLDLRGQSSPEHAVMKRQVEHLVRLVDDLLEVSRISNGNFELRKEPVAPSEVIRMALETSMPLIEERRHALALTAPIDSGLVLGDPVRLTQILTNLLNNAARFTPEGGTISIASSESEGQCVIAVTDTGKGFPADRREEMFEMFNRDSDSRGLGVGLALSRRLAQMHGGSIEAFSGGAGTGATFELRLPKVADLQAESPPATSPPAQQPEEVKPVASVLVVDDNVDAADATAALLEMMTGEVRAVYSGEAALARCAAAMPTLMLLDIGMPGMDGYEVARRVRTMQGGDRVVIAALSGWGQPEDRRRGVEAGFDHHLVKPAALEELQALVSDFAAQT